jgi:REP element-mobilizing transposase RayT
LYHVTSRGDRREDIYSGDEDRVAWLDILGAVCERFNWTCHAYCLMSNHYHLVVETIEGNLAGGMRQLNGVFTQYVNRTHGRVGHVFQGRYKAILVEKDVYLLELARYVVLNPVRARMVARAEDWPWSSHRAVIGTESAPTWLAVDGLLRGFGRTRGTARMEYIDFVRAGAGLPSIWEKLTGQIYLGGEAFVQRMVALAQDKSGELEVPRAQRRPQARPLSHYVSTYADRKEGMAQAYATGDFTLSQVAEAFGVHYATVSRAISKRRRG